MKGRSRQTGRAKAGIPGVTPFVVLLLATPTITTTPAGAGEIRFTRLVDERTLLPDGSPVVQDVWDIALDRTGNLGFLSAGRVLAVIGGEMHLVAEASGYDHLSRVEIEGDRVFWSKDNDHGGGGILRWEAGTSVELVGEDTIVPGTRCTFWGGEDGLGPWRLVEQTRLLFWGAAEEQECEDLKGVHLWEGGTIETLGPRTVGYEEGLLSCDFDDLEGDRVLRTCFGRPETPRHLGLHLFEPDGSHRVVVARGDPVPGRSTSFRAPLSARLRDGRIAFIASDDAPVFDSSGVYVWDAGSLSTFLDRETPLPDGRLAWRADLHRFDGRRIAVRSYDWRRAESFLYLTELGTAEGKVVDLRTFGGRTAWWWVMGEFAGGWLPLEVGLEDGTTAVGVVRTDGSLLRILGRDDVLDGRTVHSASLGRSRGSTLALVGVTFSDGAAIYAVELPPEAAVIDVRPGRHRNRIHPARRELVPVALLGSADFDVADVDVATLAFGPDGAPPWRGRVARRDVDGDGLDDLVARFRQRETGIARGDGEACLAGETTDGVAFEGCDVVRTLRHGVGTP